MTETKVYKSRFDMLLRSNKYVGDSYIVNDIVGGDSYEINKMYGMFSEYFDEHSTLLDVGGHIGGFGVFFNKISPKSPIVAFEPLPEAHSVYEQNMLFNDIKNATVFSRC